MVKIGINGFGRIGRLVMRAAMDHPDVEVVAINDLTDAKTNAHLFKYDSIHGTYPGDVAADGNDIVIDGKKIKVFSEREPKNLGWGEVGAEIVIESTGFFRSKEEALGHVQAGAKKVIISAPAKKEDITIVMGVNEDKYDKDKHVVLSNASCTTNCLAPVAKVLSDTFGIKRGLMTTIHSYTNDQKILDQFHDDLRRARAAAENMIPTTTGAAQAVALVLPELVGKLNGMAIRVPTANVSLVDVVFELDKKTTAAEVNAALKEAAEGSLKNIMAYNEEPLVSKDYNGCKLSSTVDGLSTMMVGEDMVKVLAWYDNETGYATRCVDLAAYIASKGL